MTDDNGNSPSGSSSVPANDGNIPHLPYALRQRFQETTGEPTKNENFIVHKVHDTDSNPYVIFQALTKLGRQTGLLETIKENRRAAKPSRDEFIHQRLEIVDSQVPGDPFYLIESQEGNSLETIINGELQLLPDEAIEIVSSLLKALEPIHEAGLVYGSMDLDLIRVVQSEEGNHVKLGGLFRVHKPDSPVRLGFSPEFNAPHAPDGEPYWTAEDDVYVVGAIAYRLLIGQQAYHSAFKSALEASAENKAGAWENIHRTPKSFPLPSTLNPDVAKEFEDWAKQALEFSRQDRYGNAHIAREALDAALKNYLASRAAGPFEHKKSTTPSDRQINIGPGQAGQEEKKKRLLFYGAAVVSVAFSVFFLIIFFAGPTAEQMNTLREKRKNVIELIKKHEIDIGRLSPENKIYLALDGAVSEYSAGDQLYPPSSADYIKALAAFERAGIGAQQANTDFGSLAEVAGTLVKAIAADMIELNKISALDDEVVQSLQGQFETAQEIAASGTLGQAKDLLLALQDRLQERIAIQNALKTDTSALLTEVNNKAAELSERGIENLAAGHPVRIDFQKINETSARAAALFDENQWLQSSEAFQIATAFLPLVQTGFADAVDALDDRLSSAANDLQTLTELSPDGDSGISELAGRFEDIRNNRNELLFSQVDTDLVVLKTESEIQIQHAISVRDAARSLLSEAEKMLAQVGLLISAEPNIIVSNAEQTYELASQAFEARQFTDAEDGSDAVLSQLENELKKLKSLRAAALKADVELSEIKNSDVFTGILALNPDHTLKKRLIDAAALETNARQSLGKRKWREAFTGFRNSRRVLETAIKALGALKTEVVSLQQQLLADIAVLKKARALETETYRNLMSTSRAISNLIEQDRLDAARERLVQAGNQVAELKEQLPDTLERLNALKRQIATRYSRIAPILAKFAEGQELRKEGRELGEAYARLNDTSNPRSLTYKISTLTSLQQSYVELERKVIALAQSDQESLEKLGQILETASTTLPVGDETLVKSARAFEDLKDKLDNNELDAVSVKANVLRVNLEAQIKRALNAKVQLEDLQQEFNNTSQAIVTEHGNWVINLPTYSAISEQFPKIENMVENRHYTAAADMVEGLLKDIPAWRTTIVSVKKQLDALSAAADVAKTLAEEANAQDTTAFRSALQAQDAAVEAREKDRYADASEHYVRAEELFKEAIQERADNAQIVAGFRDYFARKLEPARALLPDDDQLIPEVTTALELPADEIKDGSLARRRSFETLRDRLATRIAEVQKDKQKYEFSANDLSTRFEKLKNAGGQASARFANIEPEIDAAIEFASVRKWFNALEALQRAEIEISAIEMAIAEGNLLACPDPASDNGTRLIPAGSYSSGQNSLSGRIMLDAAKATRTEDSIGIVVKIAIPFCVSMRQVTFEEFDTFLAETNYEAGIRSQLLETERNLSSVSDDVGYASKIDAEAYAAWFSDKANKNYQLPTLNQTLASVAFAMGATPRLDAIVNGVEIQPREWTRESCRGENKAIVAGAIGSGNNRVFAQCLPTDERSPSIGFRLVIVN